MWASPAALQRLGVVEVDCGDVDVDGSDHGEEVCVGDTFCHRVAPALC